MKPNSFIYSHLPKHNNHYFQKSNKMKILIDMIKYEYKKVKGCNQKKFIENGHTMFEDDVLQRLKRLAHLEEQLNQTKDIFPSLEKRNNKMHDLCTIKGNLIDEDKIKALWLYDKWLMNKARQLNFLKIE